MIRYVPRPTGWDLLPWGVWDTEGGSFCAQFAREEDAAACLLAREARHVAEAGEKREKARLAGLQQVMDLWESAGEGSGG